MLGNKTNRVGSVITGLLFLLILNTVKVSGQVFDSQFVHGTFIYSSFFNDGIIICADSRGNFEDEGESKFFIDSIQKIYPLNNYVVGFSGIARIGEKTPEYFIEKAKKRQYDSPKDCLFAIYESIKEFVGPEYYDKTFTENMTIFCVGYDNEFAPLLCAINKGKYNYTSIGSIANHKIKSIKDDLKQLSQGAAKALIEFNIREYAQKQELESEIGGPITTIIIKKRREPLCLSNCNLKSWTSWSDFKNYLKNNLEIITPTGAKKDEILYYLNKFE